MGIKGNVLDIQILNNMDKERKELLLQAKRKATDTFNSLPFETRKKLANGYDRLLEVELLLGRGDNLSIAYIKKRKKELEDWLLEWYMDEINNQ